MGPHRSALMTVGISPSAPRKNLRIWDSAKTKYNSVINEEVCA